MPYQSAESTGVTLLTAPFEWRNGYRLCGYDFSLRKSLQALLSLAKPHQVRAQEAGPSTDIGYYFSD
jgi:hypothetical protein